MSRTPAALRYGTALMLLGLSISAYAESALFTNPPAPEPLAIRIELPLDNVMDAKNQEWQPAKLLHEGATHNVTIRARGKSRLRHCSFFPLWVNFKKKAVEGTVFDGQNRLKLVTHCRSGYSTRSYLAAEYLAYVLLNQLTDNSFRVRALAIEYVDSNSGKSQSRHGFFIEHKRSLAERLNADVLEVDALAPEDVDATAASLVAMFQYMIMNTDFSVIRGPEDDECCHNTVPVKAAAGVLPVAYDFDHNGFINAPYVTPSHNLGLNRTTQRLFRGLCAHNEALGETRALFLESKEALFALLQQPLPIPHFNVKKAERHFTAFYKILKNDRQFNRRITGKCR